MNNQSVYSCRLCRGLTQQVAGLEPHYVTCEACQKISKNIHHELEKAEALTMNVIQETQKAALPLRYFYIVQIGDERSRTLLNEREVNSVIHSALLVTGEVEIKVKKVMA